MTDIQRVTRVVEWLIFEKIVDNRRDLAEKMGYTESSLSQILNDKVPLSNKFIKKLLNLDNRLSEVWITTGEGEMLRNLQQNVDFVSNIDIFEGDISNINHPNESSMTMLNEMMAVIGRQSEQIGALISQHDRLISEVERSGRRADRMIDMIERTDGARAPKKESA